MSVGLKFRYAQRKDVSLILRFIKELAVYEKMLDEVIADEIMLEEWIFDRQKAEVIFAVAEGKEVGFALFFHNFSRQGRLVSGGFICFTGVQRKRIWKSHSKKTCGNCRRA